MIVPTGGGTTTYSQSSSTQKSLTEGHPTHHHMGCRQPAAHENLAWLLPGKKMQRERMFK